MRMKFAGKLNGTSYEGMPVSGIVTSFAFVIRPELSKGKPHSGNDIAAAEGTPVLAPMEGTVNDAFTTEETVQWRINFAAIFGECLILRHLDSDGELLGFTLYAHGSAGSLQVAKGDSVSQGQVLMNIGSTGQSTGPHLHWGCTVSDNPYFSRSKGLNDSFKFLDDGVDPDTVSVKQATFDEQQMKANDLIDAGQSIMNDLVDELQDKTGDL